jgi:hypothetical protein
MGGENMIDLSFLVNENGREVNKMKTSVIIVTLFFLSCLGLAQEATMTAKPQVKQGEKVTFTVKVKPAPNVNGTVRVEAKSTNGSSVINADGALAADGTSTNPEATIPLEGPTGKWTVTNVYFIPYAADAKKLTASNLPSFEVVPRKTILPDSAVVELK